MTEKFKRASLALTVLAIVLFGTGLLAISVLATIPAAERQQHRETLMLIAAAFSHDLSNTIAARKAWSQEPSLLRALGPHAGHDRDPTLKTRPHPALAPALMAQTLLMDSRGHPVVGERDRRLNSPEVRALSIQAMTQNAPAYGLQPAPGRLLLAYAFPIHDTRLNAAVGALAGHLDLAEMLQPQARTMAEFQHGLAFVQADAVLLDLHQKHAAGHFPVTTRPAIAKEIAEVIPALRLYGWDNPWLYPVAWQMVATAAAALMLGALSWHLAGVLAASTTQRLNNLLQRCREFSQPQNVQRQDGPARDAMDLLTTTVLSQLQALQQENDRLHRRVHSRTDRLLRNEGRFQSAMEALEQPLVIFNAQDELLYCNSRFKQEYPDIEPLIFPGQCFETLLRARLQQDHPGLSDFDLDPMVRDRMADHVLGDSRIDQTHAGRWVRDIQQCTAHHDTVSLRFDISELVLARQQAEAANLAKTQFLALMNHELRTPLNGVIGSAQLLLANDLTAAEHQQLVASVLQSGEGLLKLLNDLLLFSTGADEPRDLAPEPVHLAPLLEAMVARHRPLADRKGLRLKHQWHGSEADRFLLLRQPLWTVLDKLLENAIKFTHAGAVSLQARLGPTAGRGADTLEFVVEDSGIGIDPAQQPLIFNPFVQLDATSTRLNGGTGIGLAVVKHLTEQAGGRVGLNSRPGHGSTFWVAWPFVPARQHPD